MGSLVQSLKYPGRNKNDLFVIGLIFLFAASVNYACINYLHIKKTYLLMLINLFIGFFIFGFLINIIQYTIKGKDDIPIFYFKKSFKVGVKAVIVKLLYFIIPTLMVALFILNLGIHLNLINVLSDMAVKILEQSYHLEGPFNAFHASYIAADKGLLITPIITLIIFIISDGLTFMALGRLAETDSLKKAFELDITFQKLQDYGWKKFARWYMKFIILTISFVIITTIVSSIPFLGFIIVSFLLTPYYLMFKYREIGEIYIKD